MFNTFKNYLEDKITLTHSEYELIESLCSFKKLRKRQYFLQAGDICRYNVFVLTGFLRMYHLDDASHEHIMQFAPENYWTGDRESLDSGLPSKYTIDALENSEILLLTKENFELIRKTVPAFNEFINNALKKNLVVLQERIYTNISLSAEEKYRNFTLNFPSISNRVPLHMIASYLGISAETLSRIRSQSTKK